MAPCRHHCSTSAGVGHHGRWGSLAIGNQLDPKHGLLERSLHHCAAAAEQAEPAGQRLPGHTQADPSGSTASLVRTLLCSQSAAQPCPFKHTVSCHAPSPPARSHARPAHALERQGWVSPEPGCSGPTLRPRCSMMHMMARPARPSHTRALCSLCPRHTWLLAGKLPPAAFCGSSQCSTGQPPADPRRGLWKGVHRA